MPVRPCGFFLLVAALLILFPAWGAVAGEPPRALEMVRVTPGNFNRATGLAIELLLSEGRDIGDYTFTYHWRVNGQEDTDEGSPKYPGEKLTRGDRIRVDIDVQNLSGEVLETFKSQLMVVANAPPEIVSSPTQQIKGTLVEYKVKATDPDEDPVGFRLETAIPGVSIDSASGLLRSNLDQLEEGQSMDIAVIAEDGQGGSDRQSFRLNLTFVKQEVSE